MTRQPQAPTGDPLERAAEIGQLMVDLRAQVAALAEDRRAAIRSAYTAGHKVNHIARRLRVSHGRISQLLKTN